MKTILVCLTLLLFGAGCKPASSPDVLPSLASTPQIFSTNLVATVTSAPTQVNFFQPTPENPDEDEAGILRKGNQMPVFLEVTQTTIMGEDSIQSPVIDVGPAIYFYNPDSELLMLHSTISLESTTELLVGMNIILQTPGQVYDKKEIAQYPSAQPALIQISALDLGTGILSLTYAGETFSLSPGESRSFKQVGRESNSSTIVTIVANHGSLSDVQTASSDGSWR